MLERHRVPGVHLRRAVSVHSAQGKGPLHSSRGRCINGRHKQPRPSNPGPRNRDISRGEHHPGGGYEGLPSRAGPEAGRPGQAQQAPTCQHAAQSNTARPALRAAACTVRFGAVECLPIRCRISAWSRVGPAYAAACTRTAIGARSSYAPRPWSPFVSAADSAPSRRPRPGRWRVWRGRGRSGLGRPPRPGWPLPPAHPSDQQPGRGRCCQCVAPPPGTLRSRSDPPQPERRGGQQIETPSPTAAAAATSCRPPPPPDASLCCAGQRARYSVCSCWECRCERNSARSLAATRRQRATSGPATAWELRHGNCGTQWKQRGA